MADMEEIELSGLRAFVTVVESGSILAAAEAQNTARATLRRQIDKLEESIGVSLLLRGKDGVELTADGEAFLVEARQLLGHARQVVAGARELRGRRGGRLRIGLQVGYPLPMTGMIDSIVLEAGESIEHVVTEDPLCLLPDRVDIAFSLAGGRVPADYHARALTTIEQVLFASESWLEANGPISGIDDVVDRLLGSWRGPTDSEHVLHLRDGRRRPTRPQILTSDESYLIHLAANDRGLVYGPLATVAEGTQRLVPVLPDEVGRTLEARLIVPERLSEMPRIRELVDVVLSLLAQAEA